MHRHSVFFCALWTKFFFPGVFHTSSTQSGLWPFSNLLHLSLDSSPGWWSQYSPCLFTFSRIHARAAWFRLSIRSMTSISSSNILNSDAVFAMHNICWRFCVIFRISVLASMICPSEERNLSFNAVQMCFLLPQKSKASLGSYLIIGFLQVISQALLCRIILSSIA